MANWEMRNEELGNSELNYKLGMRNCERFHSALDQLLGVVQLLEDHGNVQLRLAGNTLAAAVNGMLADERQRIGDEIECDGEAPACRPHHGLVDFERVTMLLERRSHLRGFEGRSSTRLGRLRAG